MPSEELVAQTRAGKQVLTFREGLRAALCRKVQGDHVAVVGENPEGAGFPAERTA